MIELKNKLADLLMKEGKIEIEGIEINLWHGHTFYSVENQINWNKIISYTELNSHSAGETGSIVFTGVMQISRQEAADYAIKLGFNVHSTVTSKTDFVIIGTENVSPTKIARVIEFNKRDDINIKIIDEITFLSVVSEHLTK